MERATPITVIVVDDEVGIRRVTCGLLTADKEIRVVGEAENGLAAAEMARKLCPDVILMDISMPVMNGLDAAKLIVTECPKTRVILTTGMGPEPYRRASLSMGASAFIEKGSSASELIETVHKTVSLHQ